MTTRADALACWAAGLAAVEPAALVERCLVREGDTLVLRDRGGRPVAAHRGKVLVVGGGKAALGMARAAARIVGADGRGGIVIVPHGQEGECPGGVDVLSGGHPVPDAPTSPGTPPSSREAGDAIPLPQADPLLLPAYDTALDTSPTFSFADANGQDPQES